MKFSAFALTAATCISSASAEFFISENFNDEVRPDVVVGVEWIESLRLGISFQNPEFLSDGLSSLSSIVLFV